jgi:hypothetical protein
MEKKLLFLLIAICFFYGSVKAQQTLWLSPHQMVDVDGTLNITPYGGAVIVSSNTIGDLQWISLGLNLSNNFTIDSVIINYQLTNSASYISQVRLAESRLIQQSVYFDDGTDLLSTTPASYSTFVGLPFNGLVTLLLRLNFTDLSHNIYIGAVGVVVSQSVTSLPNDNIPGATKNFKLEQNYPNPFNPSTKIDFSVSSDEKVKIQIFNSNGELLTTLINSELETGNHSITWNGRDNNGNLVSSGIYFYQLQVGNLTEAKKMILLK